MQNSKLGKFQINYQNRNEYLELKNEIWIKNQYYFELDEKNEKPIIIDGGAHIGMATLYWLNQYPKAKIWAFEPNPLLAKIFRTNIEANNLHENVKLEEVAITDQNGKATLNFDLDEEVKEKWLMTGSLIVGGWSGTEKTTNVTVPTRKLSEIIKEIWRSEKREIDLLKLDIEALEEKAIIEAGNWLEKIRTVMIEYHPREEGNELEKIVKVLEKNGLGVEIFDIETGKNIGANKGRKKLSLVVGER